MSTTIEGQLEIDSERGVIYFHYKGITRLRICSLPRPIPLDAMLDITHMRGTSWSYVNVNEDLWCFLCDKPCTEEEGGTFLLYGTRTRVQ